jgi:hypothetical protein
LKKPGRIADPPGLCRFQRRHLGPSFDGEVFRGGLVGSRAAGSSSGQWRNALPAARRLRKETTMLKASPMVWTGRVLTGLFALFMLGASVLPKLAGMPVATETLTALGWKADYVLMIGIMELAFVALYLFPRTAVLGAVLMTGLLGGAMATLVRVENPLFSHELFSIYLGLFMWGGLWLRDPGLRALFPWRAAANA